MLDFVFYRLFNKLAVAYLPSLKSDTRVTRNNLSGNISHNNFTFRILALSDKSENGFDHDAQLFYFNFSAKQIQYLINLHF